MHLTEALLLTDCIVVLIATTILEVRLLTDIVIPPQVNFKATLELAENTAVADTSITLGLKGYGRSSLLVHHSNLLKLWHNFQILLTAKAFGAKDSRLQSPLQERSKRCPCLV
jgi:hypothetical protein